MCGALLLRASSVMITGNLADSGQPTTVFVDPRTPDGSGSGLNGPSLIKCYNLATVRQRRIVQVIGHLSVEPPFLEKCLAANRIQNPRRLSFKAIKA